MDAPLPWERLLWTGRPSIVAAPLAWGERYRLTDFRLIIRRGARVDEIAIPDIVEVQRAQSSLERLTGRSTVVVVPRSGRRPPLVMRGLRDGAQVAAALDLLAGDPTARLDPDAIAATLSWRPRDIRSAGSEIAAAVAIVLVAVAVVAIGLHGRTDPIGYRDDDATTPSGQKKPRDEIVRFMKNEVMPWARRTLGPIKGGEARVTCETCHGRDAEARGWLMPGVSALPKPDLKERGWEQYGGAMDAQMRNAIYGYVAESENQQKAAYMREVVMPGMAALLHRQPYDFTKSYEYNRQRAAFGCYHCHKVK